MFWLARDWPKSIGGVGGEGGMRFEALCKGWVVQFSATPCKTQPAGIIASSETQGQSVGSGEKARRKFSRTGERAPGYRLSPNYSQKFKRMPAPDWAQKMLCIIVPNRSANSFSWVPFVSSYTTAIVSITACLAHAPKKCRQSGNFQFDIKSPSDFKILSARKLKTLFQKYKLELTTGIHACIGHVLRKY